MFIYTLIFSCLQSVCWKCSNSYTNFLYKITAMTIVQRLTTKKWYIHNTQSHSWILIHTYAPQIQLASSFWELFFFFHFFARDRATLIMYVQTITVPIVYQSIPKHAKLNNKIHSWMYIATESEGHVYCGNLCCMNQIKSNGSRECCEIRSKWWQPVLYSSKASTVTSMMCGNEI